MAGVGGKWKMNMFDRSDMLGNSTLFASYFYQLTQQTCLLVAMLHSANYAHDMWYSSSHVIGW